MDIPDDLSSMSSPVPHYRDITASRPDPLRQAAANLVNTIAILLPLTWAAWGIYQIAGWIG